MKFKFFSCFAITILCLLGLRGAPARAQGQPVTPTKQGVLKIGTGDLHDPISIRTSPKGTLVVLDRRGADHFAIVDYAADGSKLAETAVPPEIAKPRTALADAEGNLYLVGERQTSFHILHPDGTAAPFDMHGPVFGMAVAKAGDAEALYVLGDRKAGVARLHLPEMSREAIALSEYPEKGNLGELRVRPDGQLYAFSPAESLVYHFDSEGKFIEKIGGGGPHPPHTGVPAGHMGSTYDVAPNGDVYWTLGDYGALLMLTADGTTGVAYHGQESETVRWTGPIHTVTGFALAGEHGYEIDGDKKRVTGFPKAFASPGAAQSETSDARVFGLSYTIKSDAPYKLFTGDTAALRIAFDEGNRRVHHVALDYRVYDYNHQLVASGTQTLEVPGSGATELGLPPLPLPRLGWYELDTAVRSGESVLAGQAHFFARVQEEPGMPIPPKEVSGWNDLATHRMIGLGLHRFGGSFKALFEAGAQIAQADAEGIPYFLALTEEKDCTPENVEALLKQYPKAPILEIVNEPNLRMAVEKYVALLKPCYEAAKKVNPQVKIMGPTQCGTELHWFENFFKNGGGNYVDLVSVHSYERHNSMDAWHWTWKFDRLREIMAQYQCGDKPLYQTEHGYLGDYHGPLLRHRWQARSLLLELMTLAQHGVGLNEYYYYYVNQGGFANFSSYLVDDDRELFPAAVMNRSRTHFIGDKKFARTLDFGAPGNLLLLGSVYAGAENDVIEFINCGALRPIDVKLEAPAGAHAFDCFGNPIDLPMEAGRAQLAVGRVPSYLVVPHGAAVKAALPDFGRNLAPDTKISVTDADGKPDAKATEGVARLTNGRLEFDFESEPERVGMRASDGNLPLDVTLDLGGAHRISKAILYSSLADNDKTSPLEYEVQVRGAGGQWQTVDSITVPNESTSFKIGGNVKRLTWYDAPWIFVHQFAPVETDAIRFHFTRTTNGQYPSPEINTEVSRAFGGDGKPLPQHVELREIQVFEISSDPGKK